MNRAIVFTVLLVLLVILRYPLHEGFESGTTVIICKAEWCGHCKKAAPEFKKLMAASPLLLKNGTKATIKMLDADADKDELKKHNVRGYPSILIQNGSDVAEYPGSRTYEDVVEYLNQSQ